MGLKPLATDALPTIFKRLEKRYPDHAFTAVNGNDPFRVLISCILSLRTQDTVSLPATVRLFKRATTLKALAALSISEIAKLIYPVGFYRNKAAQIKVICQQLLQNYDGQVPATMEGLLQFKGVGRKTANLVLSLGFNIPAICVDIHVHRISNRLGWATSKTPEQTEHQLMAFLPKRYWIPINHLMVNHGQQTCRPQRPKCDACVIKEYCQFYLKNK